MEYLNQYKWTLRQIEITNFKINVLPKNAVKNQT